MSMYEHFLNHFCQVHIITKIDKIVACFNCNHIHILSKPTLRARHITRGHNLQKSRRKYTDSASLRKCFRRPFSLQNGAFHCVTVSGYAKKYFYWMKPAQPAERIFSIPTLRMGSLRATPEEAASLIYKAEFCT